MYIYYIIGMSCLLLSRFLKSYRSAFRAHPFALLMKRPLEFLHRRFTLLAYHHDIIWRASFIINSSLPINSEILDITV